MALLTLVNRRQIVSRQPAHSGADYKQMSADWVGGLWGLADWVGGASMAQFVAIDAGGGKMGLLLVLKLAGGGSW